jgi:hypothetical protein
MATKTNKNEGEFHAVDFMREARNELTEKFLKDKQKYLDYLHQVMADFKKKQSASANMQ